MSREIIKQLPEFKFDLAEATKDALWILEKNEFMPQIGLTHSTRELTEQEKLVESTGSIFDYESKTYRFKETDFTEFNEAYKSTYLYEMWKQMKNIGRFRIMNLNGPKCYSIHQDLSMRYHFVIETNPNCLFLFPDQKEMLHIPRDGALYILDTRLSHTFVNGSKKRRIHIVVDDLASLIQPTDLWKYK
jgi:hypothetical protein